MMAKCQLIYLCWWREDKLQQLPFEIHAGIKGQEQTIGHQKSLLRNWRKYVSIWVEKIALSNKSQPRHIVDQVTKVLAPVNMLSNGSDKYLTDSCLTYTQSINFAIKHAIF